MKFSNLTIQNLVTGDIEIIKDYADMPLELRYQYLEWKLEKYYKDKIAVKIDYSFSYGND